MIFQKKRFTIRIILRKKCCWMRSEDKYMALIKCPECDNQISTSASSCPKCGFPLSTPIAPLPSQQISRNPQKIITENELWRGKPSYLRYMAYFILGIVFIPAYGIGLLIIILTFLERNTKYFLVTNKRVISKTGIIARTIHEVSIKDIRSIFVRQGVSERLLGLGAVDIASAGTAGVEVTFFGIKNPVSTRELIRRLKDEIDSA